MIIFRKKLENSEKFQRFLEFAKPHREYLRQTETRGTVFENYLVMSMLSALLFNWTGSFLSVLLFVVGMHFANFFVWYKLADPQEMKQNAIEKSIEKQTS